MAVEVGLWNACGGLGDPERAAALVQEVLRWDADIMVFPEAIDDAHIEFSTPGVSIEMFEREGYYCVYTPNADTDGRQDRRGLLVANRLPVGEPAVIDMKTRRAIGWSVLDPETRATWKMRAGHLDDRREVTRRKQSNYLIEDLVQPDTVSDPAMLVLDANSFHRTDPSSRLLRAVRYPIALVPRGEPGQERTKLRRVGSVGYRVSNMARGGPLRLFELHGFVDADPDHQPTCRLWQPDHVMLRHLRSSRLIVGENAPDLTDHRSVRATVESAV